MIPEAFSLLEHRRHLCALFHRENPHPSTGLGSTLLSRQLPSPQHSQPSNCLPIPSRLKSLPHILLDTLHTAHCSMRHIILSAWLPTCKQAHMDSEAHQHRPVHPYKLHHLPFHFLVPPLYPSQCSGGPEAPGIQCEGQKAGS